MSRRRVEEQDLHSQRWVISYADFITLLFAFFVVLYAISSVNEEKYRQVTESFAGIFSGQDGALHPPIGGKSDSDPAGIGIFQGGESSKENPTVKIIPPKPENSAALKAIGEQMQMQFKKLISSGNVAVQSNNLWVALELGANLVYPEGGALPAITTDPVFERVAKILKQYDNPIHVEGYTDNQFISSDQYPSNWELSAARAAGVVRILEMNGVKPQRMAAVGFGEYQPLADNDTESGRRVNRRIVIVVTRDRKTQRVVSAFGSEQVSEDAIRGILTESGLPESAIEPVKDEQGRVTFRRKEATQPLDTETLTSPESFSPQTQESPQ
ncbi:MULTISPECIES: flagellar motor protein MotB [Amphritea]|uniref:Chemotaxis protein MotB n=2 Tax=Amphritea TaxID=515417 RepID=A0A1H9L713_9GAMM|nr:flagellar motor protein MotB [Amphritea atlantica]MBN0986846.1 flagellar motor protein MotD [Amphritea pacifica]MBN1005287.1 flagellar motor protein MotD [Amphritea pacifica]SER07272.1 chemotaxis protein MotB [Amphritea atlantica]